MDEPRLEVFKFLLYLSIKSIWPHYGITVRVGCPWNLQLKLWSHLFREILLFLEGRLWKNQIRLKTCKINVFETEIPRTASMMVTVTVRKLLLLINSLSRQNCSSAKLIRGEFHPLPLPFYVPFWQPWQDWTSKNLLIFSSAHQHFNNIYPIISDLFVFSAFTKAIV